MATVNLSSQFENNLRRVSEVGVATFPAKVSIGGDRLGQKDKLMTAGTIYTVYTIPADSVATKIYYIVDEPFDASVTAEVKTIAGTPVTLDAAIDLTKKGLTISAKSDLYFSKTDGFAVKLSKAPTKGSFRIVAEFISASTNVGIYVDMPPVSVV